MTVLEKRTKLNIVMCTDRRKKITFTSRDYVTYVT